MSNFGSHIARNNKKVLVGDVQEEQCRCAANQYPVDGKCEQEGIIYQATVTKENDGTSETYVGLSKKSFKNRLSVHKTSFEHIRYRGATTLSNHIWNLKQEGTNFELKWRILAKSKPYSPSSKVCNLCNSEIFFILYKKLGSLNQRNEIFGYCQHKPYFKLSKQK